MSTSDIPGSRPATDSGETTSGGADEQHKQKEPQLCPPDGVSTNVSSVAINRGLLNAGVLGRGLPDFAGATPSAHAAIADSAASSAAAVSDVDVMLRVKAG